MAEYVDGMNEINNKNYEAGIEILTQCSKDGDYRASYKLGEMFYVGNIVKKDLEASGEYFDLSFKQIHDVDTTNESLYYLANIYFFGLGTVTKDLTKAAELFKKLNDNKVLIGQIMYARCLLFELGVEKDYDLAFSVLNEIKSTKHPLAIKLLGDCYLNGLGVEKNEVEAFNNYKFATDAGDLESTYMLGQLYEKGIGTDKDDTKALEYYKKAAEKHFPEAYKAISGFYAKGIAVEQSYEKQAEYLKLYADTGSVEGMFYYASLCLTSKYRLFKYTEGLNYLKKAVELRYPNATHYMGRVYESGSFGMFKNPVNAFNHYITAYNLGFVPAAIDVLRCYKLGIGVEKDEKKAAEFAKIVEKINQNKPERA